MAYSSEISLAEKQECREGRLTKVAPAKRPFDYAETGKVCAGNKFRNFTLLLPILHSAFGKGQSEVDLKTAIAATASVLLHEYRRNPRRRLAAHGAPDLSDITDMTEPESPTIIRVPTFSAESRSPQKRLARLNNPLMNGNRRVNDNKVKLEPIAASPRVEPSPTKSSSVPTTPLRSSPSPALITIQSGFQSSPLSKVSLTAPEELSPHVASNSPGRVFRAPSYTDSSSMEQMSSSPVKHDRPVAPTPSRWTRREPSTPHDLTPIPATPRTNESHIGLASIVLPSTPQLQAPPPTYNVFQTPKDASESLSFHFGDVSSAFSGMSWMNTTDQNNNSQRASRMNSRRRRQSEPLQRKYIKMESRRKSSSPKKVTFQSDDTFRDEVPMASLFTTITEASRADITSNAETVDEPIPTVVVQSIESPIKDTSKNDDISATIDSALPTEGHTDDHPSTDASGIMDIDVRENPDIFGGVVSSPPVSQYAAVSQLARIAGNDCAGQAKVVVTEEFGKLMVRFKLPTEYAYMFPESQGSDESHFSTSPSAISWSPRIKFPPPPTSLANQTSSLFEDRKTLSSPAVPELPSSIDGRTRFSAVSAINAFDQTPTIIGRKFADTPTMTGRQFADTPTMTGRQFADTPTMTSQFENTPTVTGGHFAETPNMSVPWLPMPRATSGHIDATPTQNMSSPTKAFDRTLTIGELGITSFGPSDTPTQNMSSPTKVFDRTLTIGELGITSFGPTETPLPKRLSSSPIKSTPVVHTPEVATPGSASSTLFPNLTASAKPLSPIEQTPKVQVTPIEAVASDKSPVNDTPTPTPQVMTSDERDVNDTPNAAPSPVERTPVQKPETVVEDSTLTTLGSINLTPTNVNVTGPSPKPSFTPVNQSTLDALITAPPNAGMTTPEVHTTPPVVQESAPAPTHSATYESPGRDYIQEFIKRTNNKPPTAKAITKSRRTSTTETGSPIAPPTKRLPLGAKSPNTPSPQKNKRKLDMEGDEEPSPAKRKEPTPKRVRRAKATNKKADLEIDMNDQPIVSEDNEETPAQQIEDAENEEDSAEMDNAPNTRRSTRLRSLRPSVNGPKSSIPTAIKLNRTGAGRAAGAVLNSALRSEQQELVNQTRQNTRKNKGSAEYPKQILAKIALQPEDDANEEADVSTKDGKKIGWKTPLASFQDEKPKETKAIPKPKVTLGKTGIAKPKTTSRTKRTTKVAESLGMVANGTPAKPQRMTRSRTRSQA